MQSNVAKVGLGEGSCTYQVLRHMEAPQEEVPDHPQVYRLRGQDGLQREVPVRPEGRPGQGLDAMRYEDGYLMDI